MILLRIYRQDRRAKLRMEPKETLKYGRQVGKKESANETEQVTTSRKINHSMTPK